MSYTRKIAHNTIIQIIGKAISTIIGVVVIGMLTRYLGQAGFGQYTTIMAFLQLFGVLVDMGLYIILVKKISEPNVDSEQIVSNIFTLRLISAILFLGLAPIIVLFFPYPAVVKLGVLVTALSFLGITLTQVLTGIFQKNLRMDKVVLAEVFGRIVLIVTTYFVIKADLGLIWVMVSVVAGSLLNFFILFAFSRQFVRIKLSFDFFVWRQVVKESWPIALSIAFNLIYLRADIIILSLYHKAEDVGIYGASYKVLDVLVTFPAVFAGLVLPLLTAAWVAQNREKFQRVLRKSFDFMFMAAAPLVVGTFFISKPVMDLIAPEFRDSAAVLNILIIAAGIIFIGNLFGNTVVAINKQKTMMWLYLAVAIISLAGYLIFIPKYSYFGAAWMTIASEFMVTISAGLIVCLTAKIWPSFRLLGKALISVGVMALVLHFMAGYNLFLLIITAGVVYFAALYLLKGITKEMIGEILRIKE